MKTEPRRRADESQLLGLRPQTSDSDNDPTVSLCAFEVGGEGFVLDLLRVREILRPMKVTPVPKAPTHLEGVIHLRGAVIPVVDLRKRLGVEAIENGSLNRLIVCRIGRRQVGLVVDRVTNVLRIPISQILPTPDLWLEGGARYFLGVCGEGQDLKLLLNLKALLSSSEPVPRPVPRPSRRIDAGESTR
jgi:purine-binding chemotaxis protein CheW